MTPQRWQEVKDWLAAHHRSGLVEAALLCDLATEVERLRAELTDCHESRRRALEAQAKAERRDAELLDRLRQRRERRERQTGKIP